MIRAVAAATAALALGGIATAGGTAMHTLRTVLSSPVAAGTTSVSVEDAPHDAAVLHATGETPLLAVSAGTLSRVAPAALLVHGTGDDAGLDVEYAGVDSPTTAAAVERGARLGDVPRGAAAVTLRAALDGSPLDVAALLRAALDGSVAEIGEWTRPVDRATVSQPFGCTPYAMEPVDRACPSGHIHTGIDLAVPLGTPVRAAMPGVVRVVVSATGYGLHVIVDDGAGLTTLYAHLESVVVHDGDIVDSGDLLGAAGSTGNSTGPHLHFEVRRDAVPEDPTLDLALP